LATVKQEIAKSENLDAVAINDKNAEDKRLLTTVK
jgi:hypothetical protein